MLNVTSICTGYIPVSPVALIGVRGYIQGWMDCEITLELFEIYSGFNDGIEYTESTDQCFFIMMEFNHQVSVPSQYEEILETANTSLCFRKSISQG